MLNKIYHGKSEDVIDQFPDKSINLILTSPPYNVDLGNNRGKRGGYDEYEDNLSYDDFLNERRIFFYKAKRILADDARVVINIGDRDNGRIPVASDLIHIMTKELGYKMFSTIIWNKKQTSRRSAWGSFMSPSLPSFPTPYEYILIFSKDSLKLLHIGEADISKNEFIHWSMSYWEFSPEMKMSKFDHPAMFPEELPKRCIKMLTYKGDTVLDPYNGVGTTCVAAKKLGRNYIGIDLSKKYCDTAEERLRNIIEMKEIEVFFESSSENNKREDS